MSEVIKYSKDVISGKIIAPLLIIKACKRFLGLIKRNDIEYRPDVADAKIAFIETHVYQWEGEWEELPFTLELWQKFIIHNIFGIYKDGRRLITRAYIQVPRKNGKALDLNTELPTPKGWMLLKDLSIGDYVFDVNGKKSKILAESEIEEKECYEFTFTGGAKVVSSIDHLWEVYHSDYTTPKKILTTSNIVDKFNALSKCKLPNPIRVKVSGSIDYPKKTLNINPYILGLWLGDGTSAGNGLTIGDEDEKNTLKNVADCGWIYSERKRQKNKCGTFGLGTYGQLVTLLRGYNLIKNKHIPDDYLLSDKIQRLELLKGLMDTDGYCSKLGQCEYSGINKKLVNGVFELVCSLGFKATFRSKIAKSQTGYEVRCYYVSFFSSEKVFKLERKNKRLKKKLSKRSFYKSIISIKKVGIKKVKCIAIDSNNKLFLVTRQFIPTHNTAYISAITNEHLFADNVKTPQILVGANNEDQAKICTTATAKMIEASPTLSKYKEAGIINIYSYKSRTSSIVHTQRNGSVIAMSRELKSKDGFNPSLGVIDEYHMAQDSNLLDVIRSGQGSRPEPLLIVITTAGFNKSGPCYSILRRVSIDILNGIKTDDSHFSMIYEPDIDDDWELESTWRKVNPNYGISVFPHYLKSRYLEAKNEGARKEIDFKTKNLNVWTNSSKVWVTDEIWMNNDLEPIINNGKRWYLGLDMAVKHDFTALVMVSEFDKDGFVDVIPYFWIPEETVQDKADNEHSDMLDWVRDGLVFTTPGNVTDHRAIVDFVLKLRDKHSLIQLVADQAFAISTMNSLNESGIDTVGLPQTAQRLTPPINLLYRLLMEGKVRHGGNPVLRWMASNCVFVEQLNGLVRIEKEGAKNKIDGIDALLDALYPFDIPIEPKKTVIAEIW